MYLEFAMELKILEINLWYLMPGPAVHLRDGISDVT